MMEMRSDQQTFSSIVEYSKSSLKLSRTHWWIAYLTTCCIEQTKDFRESVDPFFLHYLYTSCSCVSQFSHSHQKKNKMKPTQWSLVIRQMSHSTRTSYHSELTATSAIQRYRSSSSSCSWGLRTLWSSILSARNKLSTLEHANESISTRTKSEQEPINERRSSPLFDVAKRNMQQTLEKHKETKIITITTKSCTAKRRPLTER